MLSYQHRYHAGNHADVLKHMVLVALLEHLCTKDKPFSYVETHAGAGCYDLEAPEAQRLREHETGIVKLFDGTDLPELVAAYVGRVRAANGDAAGERTLLKRYPGSPALALALRRPQDPIDLFELHPGEFALLSDACGAAPRLRLHQADGLEGCIGLLPPPSRRGLILVDPSYETRTEFDAVLRMVQRAHRRFATGTIAIWYPVVVRQRVEAFCRSLVQTAIPDILRVELNPLPDGEGRGMTGSGMLVVNPAWTLERRMGEALPWLAQVLGDDGRGSCRVERLAAE
ncbi:MAG: 23S rRNA (adenine(2030)-N(6))-methyltransferase RlmJ [Pseudomonadales bacterium]|nr:23S rRNA (adenine(2030)-N(6))-methyltransferase RlmJ [Pseudomonadales bacterium]